MDSEIDPVYPDFQSIATGFSASDPRKASFGPKKADNTVPDLLYLAERCC